eukprot:120103-Pleurochrysis_carterae.AAC.1
MGRGEKREREREGGEDTGKMGETSGREAEVRDRQVEKAGKGKRRRWIDGEERESESRQSKGRRATRV